MPGSLDGGAGDMAISRKNQVQNLHNLVCNLNFKNCLDSCSLISPLARLVALPPTAVPLRTAGRKLSRPVRCPLPRVSLVPFCFLIRWPFAMVSLVPWLFVVAQMGLTIEEKDAIDPQ